MKQLLPICILASAALFITSCGTSTDPGSSAEPDTTPEHTTSTPEENHSETEAATWSLEEETASNTGTVLTGATDTTEPEMPTMTDETLPAETGDTQESWEQDTTIEDAMETEESSEDGAELSADAQAAADAELEAVLKDLEALLGEELIDE